MSSHQKLDSLYEQGFIVFPKKVGGQPMYKQYVGDGVPYQDVWAYQPNSQGLLYDSDEHIDEDVKWLENEPERVGYPTQKPIGLLERIIVTSSNPGAMVVDPFCGCATTPIAAERLGRQWVGIDIWDRAYKTVLDRLESEALAVPHSPEDVEGQPTSRLLTFGDIHYSKEPPERTDEGEVAAPILRLKLKRPMEPWQRLSHKQIVDHLVTAQTGVIGMVVCAGCGRELEREFMQLDHIQPRAEGGVNDITNRILLCQPCNGRKSADLTLRGLIRENKRQNWMQSESRAKLAQDSARVKADMIRDGLIS